MGSDDLYYKKKQRSIRSLKRRENKRESYDIVLIVCEGEKTEPNYLNAFKNDLKLSNTNIKITNKQCGNDPLNISRFAIEEYNNKEKIYDRVYCVFDKDQATNYREALKQIQTHHNNGVPIYAITSVPCFEYWFLLHFIDTTRPYCINGNKTASEQLVSELRQHFDYKKNDKYIYFKIKDKLNTAIKRAKCIDKTQQEIGTDNPSTKVYQLAEYLLKIKNQSPTRRV